MRFQFTGFPLLSVALAVTIVLAAVACGGGNEKNEPEAELSSAVSIAEALAADGLDFTVSITDITSATDEGPISKAATATDVADVFVEVYQDSGERNAARLALVEADPGAAFIAECGPILVLFTTQEEAAREQARQAQQILEADFGPC